MSRFFTDDQIEILSQKTVRLDILARFDFASGSKYAWNGNRKIETGGNTYLPMYQTGQIDGLALSGGTVSEYVEITASGLPDQALDYLAEALDDTPDIDQQTAVLSVQLFTDEWQPSGIPIPVFVGAMQPPRVSRTPMQDENGGAQSIGISIENIFFNRARPPHGRYTDRDQQARSLGDKIFGFVAAIITKPVTYPDF